MGLLPLTGKCVRSRTPAVTAALGLLLGQAGTIHAGGWAQRQDEAVSVILAALPAVRPLLPEGTAALNAEPICKARLIGWNCSDEVREAVESNDFVLSSRDFTYVCLAGPDSCRLIGVRSLTSFATPEVRGNAATVEAEILWRTGHPRRRLAELNRRVHLARRGSGWRIVRVEEIP